MAFKSVNPASTGFVTPRKWKEWAKGEFVIGTLQECTQKDKFKKPIYAVKVIESNFGAKVGETLYLNCGGNFRNMMDQVEEGEKVKILYRGENVMGPKSSHPGEKTHDIDVQVEESGESDDQDGLL